MTKSSAAASGGMNVAADAQGHGVGKFAVQAQPTRPATAASRRLTVIWEPGEEGPEEFLPAGRLLVVGETQYGEIIGVPRPTDGMRPDRPGDFAARARRGGIDPAGQGHDLRRHRRRDRLAAPRAGSGR